MAAMPLIAANKVEPPKKVDSVAATGADQPTTKPTTAPADPEPEVKVSGTKGEIDLGYVPLKKKQSLYFLIDNPTKQPIKIKKIRSECKCMAVASPPIQLEPKSDTAIKVILDAPAKSEKYSKRFLIVTADRERPIIELMVKADVGLPLATQPEVQNVGTIQPGRQYETQIKIINRGKKAIKPVYAISSAKGWVANVARSEIQAGGEIKIPVDICVGEKTPGQHSVNIAIHTNCPGQANVKAWFNYTIAPLAGAETPTAPKASN